PTCALPPRSPRPPSRRLRARTRPRAGSPSRCVPPFDAGEHGRQLLETPQIMAWQEPVDIWQRRPHAPRERLILRISLEAGYPDDRVCGARELRHLAPHELRVLALPAVGDDEDDRAAGERAPAVHVVELAERCPDPRPAAPVDDRLGAPRERGVRVARREVGGQPREARPERERLDAAPRPDDGMEEEEQRPRVAVHRARDVAQHDELARHVLPRPERPVERIAARAQRAADHASDGEPVAARVRRSPPRVPFGPRARYPADQLAQPPELVAGQLGEVLVAQELLAGGAELERIALLSVLLRLARAQPVGLRADARLGRRRRPGTGGRQDRRAEEPRAEGAIEQIQLVVPG